MMSPLVYDSCRGTSSLEVSNAVICRRRRKTNETQGRSSRISAVDKVEEFRNRVARRLVLGVWRGKLCRVTPSLPR